MVRVKYTPSQYVRITPRKGKKRSVLGSYDSRQHGAEMNSCRGFVRSSWDPLRIQGSRTRRICPGPAHAFSLSRGPKYKDRTNAWANHAHTGPLVARSQCTSSPRVLSPSMEG